MAKKPTADATSPGTVDTQIEDLIKAIRQTQQNEADGRAAVIQQRLELGKQLAELKTLVKHGEWATTLQELGYVERSAARLMQFAASPLAKQISTRGTDLAGRLPVDLQSLITICTLSEKQLSRLLTQDVDEMSRRDLDNAVTKITGKQRKPRIIRSVSQSQDDTRDAMGLDQQPVKKNWSELHEQAESDQAASESDQDHEPLPADDDASADVMSEDADSADQGPTDWLEWAASKCIGITEQLAGSVAEELRSGTMDVSEVDRYRSMFADAQRVLQILVNECDAAITAAAPPAPRPTPVTQPIPARFIASPLPGAGAAGNLCGTNAPSVGSRPWMGAARSHT